MRRLFAFALVALLVGVGIVAVIQTDPGYVLVAYDNYTLESSLWVGLVLLVLAVLAVFLLLRLIFRIVGGQRTLFTWLGARKARKAQRLSTRGLISFTEGNWATARRQLVNGAQHNEAPLLNYLLAARCSEQLEDSDKVQEYLHAAAKTEPDAAMAVELERAKMKLQTGDYAQALATLDQSARNVSRHPHILTLQCEAYRGMHDWDKLVEILPQLQKHKLLTDQEFQQLEREVHLKRLEQGARDSGQLHANWQQVPRHLQRDVIVIDRYALALERLGEHDTAEKTIARALKQDWSPLLVRRYGYVQASQPARQLALAERWLDTHREDAQLLLCLGRLAARNKLWGKARDYFESSYRVESNAEICAELGRLLTALGEPQIAAAYFREGLLQSAAALPNLPMPEKLVPDSRLLAHS